MKRVRKMANKFAGALGILQIQFEKKQDGKFKFDFDLKPDMKDVRLFRNIILNPDTRKDKRKLFDSVVDYSFNLIKRQYKDEPDEQIKEFVEVYANPMFEKFMLAYKWTTKEDLEKARKEQITELKKEMSDA